jgi:hypothetical protein
LGSTHRVEEHAVDAYQASGQKDGCSNSASIAFSENSMQQVFHRPDYFLFAGNSSGTQANGSSMSVSACSQ